MAKQKIFGRADPVIAKQTLRIFYRELSKDKKSMALYVTLIPINRLLYIVILPLIFSFILQSMITNPHDWHHPLMLIVLSVAVAVVALISSFIGFNKLFHHEEKTSTVLMKLAMDKLVQHSDQFFANNKVGALAGDVSLFSRSVVAFLDTIFLAAMSVVVNFTASLVIIAFLSPALLIPFSIVTVFLVFHSVRSITNRGDLRKDRKEKMSHLTGTVADILGNHQIVRFFAGNTAEIKRIADERAAIEAVSSKEIDVIQREAFVRQSVLFGLQIITLAIAVYLFSNGIVTIAALIFAVTYMGRLTGSLFEIGSIVRNIEQAFLDASKVTSILNEPLEVVDEPDAKLLKVKNGEIEFASIDFAYNDSKGRHVIEDLSLIIKAGQRVGLVGHSGGGKTTLAKLVLRFADVDAGEILIDGQNIRSVTQDSLRQQVAYVPQEASLFHRSLRENVGYGKAHVTDKEIKQALRQANAEEFTSTLSEGLDTIVGERGVKLSGGQRQRIAIARALLKNAPILILDEATSALDSASEQLIQRALEELMQNRTSIVIAHRLSTIAKLDRIIVLDSGKIIEDGSHAELLEQKGAYAKLWAHQSGGFIKE
ncbi:MAG: putative transporter ATP-binding protein [Candidatus Saccharibacteria bacterium]|nr:putative transporter ATP-binding protein [Candidatus Saccharibacteria bacterium]